MNNVNANSEVPITVAILNTILQRFVWRQVRWYGFKHASSLLSVRNAFPAAGCGPSWSKAKVLPSKCFMRNKKERRPN